MFEKVTKSFSYGAHTVTLETGEIARQADGAVLCSVGDTVVLATVVARRQAKPGQDFFPLTVDYVEKTYAAGRIPGGFFKREGRPSEKETLTSRLIDRPLRPLFPDGFYNEVQVVIHVLSVDAEIDPDIPALIGASAAVSLAGIPFKGPIGAARVGYVDGQYVINPTATQLTTSQMNLVVAGTERAVLMVESEADQLPEDVMLGGVMHGHQQMQAVINAIHDLVRDAGKPAWEWQPAEKNEALMASLVQTAGAALREAYQMRSKQARQNRIKEIYASTLSALRHPKWTPTKPATSCSISKRRSFVARFWTASLVSTGATLALCGRSQFGLVFCRARTALRCLPVVKRRRSSLQRSAPSRTNRSLMHFKANIASASCFTTTCRRLRLAKRAESAHRSGAKSAMVVWQSVHWWHACRRTKIFSTRFASCRRSPNRTVRRQWHRCAADVLP